MINPKKYGIINSGLLISLDAFFFVGGYNDRVSVDFADFQFIERYSNVFKEAYVVDVTCKQSFSNEGQTIEQKLTRYKMFCNSLKNYEPIKARNRLWISMVVIKRALSLCIESRKLSPLSFLIKYYLK